MKEKFKSLMLDDRYFYSLVILVVATCSFGLGRATVISAPSNYLDEVKIFNPAEAVAVPEAQKTTKMTKTETVLPIAESASVFEETEVRESSPVSTTQPYVASKSGTKYHLSSCPGAKQIKPENKITFASKSEAEAAGYSPAANCPGL